MLKSLNMESMASINSMLKSSETINIGFRVLTLILLVMSIVLLSTNVMILKYEDDEFGIHFRDVIGYRYMLFTIVIGITYTSSQIAVAIYGMKKELNHQLNSLFEFYGDKVISSLLATGAAAGFVMTKEMQKPFELVQLNFHSYFSKAYASEILLLLGFAITEALLVMSWHALHNQNKSPKLSQKEENITHF